MHPELERALRPVLADLQATSTPVPRIEDSDWSGDAHRPGAMLWSPDGSGRGVATSLGRPQAEQVVDVADQVQEGAVEELWGSAPTNWPACPHHPTTHPLEAQLHDGAAWWVCLHHGTAVSKVGRLG
ncbi:hypothetical protein KUM42_05435 [Modestobacter sp. L9-4]|uniref:hypothetical protein n=1 Tax=Modestobacter sp. L9-4 TaxID=2851567 RepID=UPI001C78E186|nr:hypothetical protein [Modestobacter sp. L9-4]QXG76973.1 hypothetical protein KUM42_05435 [Modestobacter sp. L9-4]